MIQRLYGTPVRSHVNEQQTLHEPKGMERGRRASRASFRIRSAMERSHPLGSESADRLVVVDWQRAKRGFDFARIDDEISVRRGTLKEWPVIPRRAHMHVVVCDGRQHSTFRVVLDQARCLNLPRGSMGRGLKLVSSNCDAALPFCVVALCRTKERLTEAFDRSPGGEEGYGMLRAKSTFVIYDIARSPAYLVNYRRASTHKLCLPTTLWNASIRVRSKTPCLGHVFAPYGCGSAQHTTMAAAEAERNLRAPAINEKRVQLKEKMRALNELRWRPGANKEWPRVSE